MHPKPSHRTDGSSPLTIGALSRATGIPAETLRTWERRYGAPQPVRKPSGHRLYPSSAIEHLRRVRRLLERGHRAGEIVRLSIRELDAMLGLAETRRPGPGGLCADPTNGSPDLRATGLAVVTRDGRDISRLRSAARVLITWSAPFAGAIGLWVYAEMVTSDGFAYASPWGIGGIYLLPAIGALWTIAHPERGLHDRLAGTWVVPR